MFWTKNVRSHSSQTAIPGLEASIEANTDIIILHFKDRLGERNSRGEVMVQ